MYVLYWLRTITTYYNRLLIFVALFPWSVVLKSTMLPGHDETTHAILPRCLVAPTSTTLLMPVALPF